MYLFKFNDGSRQIVKLGSVESVWPSPDTDIYERVSPFMSIQVNGNQFHIGEYDCVKDRDEDYNRLIKALEG